MAKHVQTFEHTADIGVEAWADTAGELYEALAEGMADIICPRDSVRAQQTRPVEVSAEDGEALAVDFLSAVLNVIQADRFMLARVEAEEATDTHIRAQVWGEPYDPARHEISTEIKAVTYHLLKIAQEGERWVGRVIFDL